MLEFIWTGIVSRVGILFQLFLTVLAVISIPAVHEEPRPLPQCPFGFPCIVDKLGPDMLLLAQPNWQLVDRIGRLVLRYLCVHDRSQCGHQINLRDKSVAAEPCFNNSGPADNKWYTVASIVDIPLESPQWKG